MPDLIAQGPQPQHRWRRSIPPGAPQTIGRASGPWSTPWDDRVSRRHVEIVLQGGQLLVQALPEARNPVFHRGQQRDAFALRTGDHFVIGSTTFTLADDQVRVVPNMPHPANERTFTLDELRGTPFRHADKRIEVLGRLPDIISGSATDQEMFVRLVNLLLSGIERALAAAVVEVKMSPKFDVPGSKSSSATLNLEPGTLNPVSVLHWDRRILAGTEFRPSERLIRQAVESGASVAHVWAANQPRGAGEFTLSEGVDWAFCTPIAGEGCKGWGLYVTGSFGADFAPAHEPDPEQLRDDVKFAELTAATLAALRESRLLAARQAGLAQFFSPVVLAALGQQDPDQALAPREADVTVLFCDLRGFTQQSERSAGSLFDLLARVSQALGVMTRHILREGGVVGDFHGDSAMGFWGWPLPQADAVPRACRAALAIAAEFAAQDADFQVGIGIASGRAVAGKIGSADQVKVTVFGPVVNLAARLETMTKQLRVAILIDPPTAAIVRASVPPTVARVRRLAKVRPVGLSAPLDVSELVPPATLPLPSGAGRGEGSGSPTEGALTDQHLSAYEAALAALEARDWNGALKLLHQVPPDDQAKDFLTVFIAQHQRTPPADWDGAITLAVK
ncbi:MAG: adenylate/guanylate cyclase domain-containing protein [Pirellulaceae bacterium]|nr:adenylate/guanylate cyclase domain-containing protein [Pirellulaceae bacterium]